MKVAPICAQAGITGFESPAAEYKELGLSLDDLLIHHPNATFLALASGCSMQEIGIFDGDILIVDRAMDTQNGDVIVANYNGELVCKIIDKQHRQLLSASPQYSPVTIRETDVFQLEGVVIRAVRMLRGSARLCSR
ncbi:MAG: Protein UmuD [Candidatus Celerinatantimonas neptuna]|nr:MAG: Protein UmuD [Candidatus Celerinatantimonas neptuna]